MLRSCLLSVMVNGQAADVTVTADMDNPDIVGLMLSGGELKVSVSTLVACRDAFLRSAPGMMLNPPEDAGQTLESWERALRGED